MKKLISLNPFNPPLYPLINVIKNLAGEEITPISSHVIRELESNVNDIIGINGFKISVIEDGRLDYNAYPAVDITIGRMEKVEKFVVRSEPLDLTGLPAYCYDLSQINAPTILYTIDRILGIDKEVTIVLTKDPKNEVDLSDGRGATIRFISKLLGDYQLQRDLIVRDLKYKSALLQNLLEHPRIVKIHFDEMPFPSPCFAFFIPDSSSAKFVNEIKQSGFEIGVVNSNGKDHYAIANFINHSKEQVERFIDVMDRVLTKVLF